jgi:hypothetical protein
MQTFIRISLLESKAWLAVATQLTGTENDHHICSLWVNDLNTMRQNTNFRGQRNVVQSRCCGMRGRITRVVVRGAAK